MTPADLVYKTVYERLMAEDVPERISKDQAVLALDSFKKNKFSKVTNLIDEHVKKGKSLKPKKKKK